MFDPRRHVQRPRRRFENRFRNVVLISAVQILDVQIESAFLHERLQELFNQLRLQIANPRRLEFRFVYQVRPARQINDHARQSFIQRNVCMSKATIPRRSPSASRSA